MGRKNNSKVVYPQSVLAQFELSSGLQKHARGSEELRHPKNNREGFWCCFWGKGEAYFLRGLLAICYHIMLMRANSLSSVIVGSQCLLCLGKRKGNAQWEKNWGARARHEAGPQGTWDGEVGGASGTTQCCGPAALLVLLLGCITVLPSSLAPGMEV